MKIVATHNGRFHTDEVFAIAILKLVFQDLKIIRTRKQEEFKDADFRVDIGRRYHPETGNFDHHQEDFKLKRENKIPYASAGLIWKEFGKKLVNSEKAFNYIDEKLIQPIDADDNGINLCENDVLKDYNIADFVRSFKPIWDKDNDYDKAFEEALLFSIDLLKREIELANAVARAEKILKEIVSKTEKEYIVIEQNIPWMEYLIANTKLKFVVQKNSSDNWGVYAIPVKLGSFESRKDLPKEWAGLDDEELVKACGVEDAFSCHKGRFTIAVRSKEGAIKLAELAIKNKEK